MATVAAFLLVPAAQALAYNTVTIEGAGEGSGWVKGYEINKGNPPVDCHWNGKEWDVGTPKAGECESEAVAPEGTEAFAVEEEADPGSVFGGWKIVEGGFGFNVCEEPLNPICGGLLLLGHTKIQAKFNEIPPPLVPLTVTSSGAPGGEVKCSINGGAKGSCPAEAPEGKNVKLFAEGTGVELNEWTTGPCASTSANPCSFAMPASAVSANADFQVAQETLTVTEPGAGSGTVACEVNSVVEPCNGTYEYGKSVKLVATPDPGNEVESITGPGCSVIGAGEASTGECVFTLEEDTTVTVVFESAGTKESVPATIEGEVPKKTSLEGCAGPVILGPFEPAVPFNYEGTCSLIATSTGDATELSAADPDETATKGHLVNGSYSLPSALETRANGLGGLEFPATGYPYAPLSEPSVTLLTYGGPVSADNVTVHFKQHIGLHDALADGTYAKTITLTLEQTTP